MLISPLTRISKILHELHLMVQGADWQSVFLVSQDEVKPQNKGVFEDDYIGMNNRGYLLDKRKKGNSMGCPFSLSKTSALKLKLIVS